METNFGTYRRTDVRTYRQGLNLMPSPLRYLSMILPLFCCRFWNWHVVVLLVYFVDLKSNLTKHNAQFYWSCNKYWFIRIFKKNTYTLHYHLLLNLWYWEIYYCTGVEFMSYLILSASGKFLVLIPILFFKRILKKKNAPNGQ